jgi:hypothetical protein
LLNALARALPPRRPRLCAPARKDFTIRREILWESETATQAKVTIKEAELIVALKSNDPAVGYNQWPKFKGKISN